MKYKLISKSFQSMNAAETFLSALYEKHDHARCIGWPSGGETGKYTFEVSDNPRPSLIPSVHTNVQCMGENVPVILSHN